MWLKKILLNRFCICLVLLFCFLSHYAHCQDVSLQQKLTNLSSNIHEQLNEAKTHSVNLSQSLTELRYDLSLSNEQRVYYQAISNDLEISLQNMIQSSESLSRELTESRIALAKAWGTVRALLWIAAIIILGKIAAFMLYWLKIPTPRWLDIIL